MALYYGDVKSKKQVVSKQPTLTQMFERPSVPRTLNVPDVRDVRGLCAGDVPPGDASSRLHLAQRGGRRSSGDMPGDISRCSMPGTDDGRAALDAAMNAHDASTRRFYANSRHEQRLTEANLADLEALKSRHRAEEERLIQLCAQSSEDDDDLVGRSPFDRVSSTQRAVCPIPLRLAVTPSTMAGVTPSTDAGGGGTSGPRRHEMLRVLPRLSGTRVS